MRRRPSTSGYHPLRKLKVMLNGLYLAVITDFSVAYKLVLSMPILVLSCIFYQWIHLTIVLLATGMVLVAELLNSAIEILCDFVEQQDNVQIGAIKDIAAAAAGVSIFVWGVIMIIEIVHFWNLYYR